MFGRARCQTVDQRPDWFLYIPADEPAISEAVAAGWTDQEVYELSERIASRPQGPTPEMTEAEAKDLADKWTMAAEDLKRRLQAGSQAGEIALSHTEQ